MVSALLVLDTYAVNATNSENVSASARFAGLPTHQGSTATVPGVASRASTSSADSSSHKPISILVPPVASALLADVPFLSLYRQKVQTQSDVQSAR